MKNIEDGGPAYPNVPSDPQYENWDQGMSLRDHFAALAMQKLIEPMTSGPYLEQHGGLEQNHDAWVAKRSYEIADAMIYERNHQ